MPFSGATAGDMLVSGSTIPPAAHTCMSSSTQNSFNHNNILGADTYLHRLELDRHATDQLKYKFGSALARTSGMTLVKCFDLLSAIADLRKHRANRAHIHATW